MYIYMKYLAKYSTAICSWWHCGSVSPPGTKKRCSLHFVLIENENVISSPTKRQTTMSEAQTLQTKNARKCRKVCLKITKAPEGLWGREGTKQGGVCGNN